MSAKPNLYLVTLQFSNELVGSGHMLTQFAVNPQRQTIHGQAHGTFLEGTEHPRDFQADFDGGIRKTGFGNITTVGSGQGKALVTTKGSDLSAYLSDFAIDFAVDDDWNGTGRFTIDGHTYQCEVKSGG